MADVIPASLLPTVEAEEEEEGDPRAELVRKLLEYQAFREAAKKLGLFETERGKVFTRQVADHYLGQLSDEDLGIDAFGADLFDLINAFHSVLQKLPEDTFQEVYEEVITIEERIAELKQLLTERKELVFRELFLKENVTRNKVIVTFLALLELVRSKFARVFQEKHFGDILITRKEA